MGLPSNQARSEERLMLPFGVRICVSRSFSRNTQSILGLPWIPKELERSIKVAGQTKRAAIDHHEKEALMATIQNIWLSRESTGHRVRKVGYGYTLQANGKQGWCFRAARLLR